MGQAVHGHEVLEMMLAAGRAWRREELIQEIHQRFGEDARFHTCSAEGMTAEELLSFLEARGKFRQQDQTLQADPDRICKD